MRERWSEMGVFWYWKSQSFLTQESDPGETMLIDACNGFNELRRLATL